MQETLAHVNMEISTSFIFCYTQHKQVVFPVLPLHSASADKKEEGLLSHLNTEYQKWLCWAPTTFKSLNRLYTGIQYYHECRNICCIFHYSIEFYKF